MSCVKAFTGGIRCLISTRKAFHKMEAFMKDGYLVAIKVRFNFKVNSDPKRLAFAAQVKINYARCFEDLTKDPSFF